VRNVLKTQFNKKVGALLTCFAWLCFAAPVPAAPGDVDPLNANLVGSFVVATAVQPDGKTILAGNVTSVLGQPRNNIARLNADGTLDAGFNPNANGQILGVAVQADATASSSSVPTVILSTANLRTTATTLTITGTSFSTTPGHNTVVFTPAGTGTVTASTATSLTVTSLAGLTLGALNAVVTTSGLSSGAAVQVATVALTLPGDVDPLNLEILGAVRLASITSTVVQPDGKTIIAGFFRTVLGRGIHSIARINADGTLDSDFIQFFFTGVEGTVNSVALQADGKILVGGEFSSVLGSVRNNIARLNANGRLDTGFNPNADGRVYSVAVQADGKILIGGEFFTVGGINRLGLARLNANGTLDAGFNPNVNWIVRSVVVQTDGRILLGGEFDMAGGIARWFLARVDAAGALDTGFNADVGGSVTSVAVQADGRILLGGEFATVGGTLRTGIARVNANGTLDAGFNPNPPSAVRSVAVQADGRILLGGLSFGVGGITRNGIARLNANGTLDAGFNPDVDGLVQSVAVQADGRILLGGEFTAVGGTPRNSFARLLNDPATQTLSTPDATQVTWTRGGSSPEISQVTFEQSTDSGATWTALGSGTRIGTTPNWQLTGLALTGSGQLRARGRTSGGYQNGSSSLVEATVEYGLAAPTVTLSTAGLRMTETTLTITGTSFSPTPGNNSVAFTPAGTGTVTAATATSLTVSSLSGLTLGALNAVVTTYGQTSGSAVQVATVVVPGPGDVDPLNVPIGPIGGSYVLASAVQPDGKTILAGSFNYVLGQPRNNIARLNADGTLDAGFNPGANGQVHAVAVQADGRILFGGVFGSVGGIARSYIARVDAAGALDTGFNPNANNSVNSVAVQADGRILLGGDFTTLQPNGAALATTRNRIARVDAAGALDAGFNPNANNSVSSVAVQADGRILLGGDFTALQPNGAALATTRNNIARLNADGSLDAGFNPDANGPVYSVAVQADGRILLGGGFTVAGGDVRLRIARLHAFGALDTGFNPSADSIVRSVAVQADGRILLGGFFTALQPHGVGPVIARNRIARVDAAGAPDAGFNPNADNIVYSVAVQADGRILLGGAFSSMGGNSRNGFARLVNDPAIQLLSAPDATQVTWTRGGSAPEVSQVTFEQSTDSGATWTPLGSGTRIGTTPNWQLTGLSLPATGQLRARGRTTGGYQNGSSGLVERVASFGFPPEIAVSGNSVNIPDGDATPALADHTDFGSVNVAGSTLVRTYTITNSGTADLTLGTVTVGGTHTADFTVSLQPVSPVAPSGSTSFQVTFDPSAPGPRSATLSFSNNDADEDPFNFAIQGTGTAVPDAPLILSAMPRDQAARIAFNTPISDGGSAILDYSASCTPGPISNTQNALVIDVGGLTNNVAYRCSVRARNAIGMSAPSGELSVIPGSSGTSADLSITKTNNSDFVNGGAAVEYMITVTNPGPAGVIGARVEDAIGAGTDFSAALWTCTPLNNAACPSPANGSGSLNALVDLPATSSVQFVFAALPNPGPETPVTNTASVTPPANITDANPNNNVASDGPDVRGIFRNGFE